MWGPSPEAADLIFRRKKLAAFLVITVHLSGVSSQKLGTFFAHHSPSLGSHPLFPACKNLPLLLWGPFLCGPCSTEHAEHA